jgi:hypothetical protein
MHVGASQGRTQVIDAQALPRILDAISDRGYRVIDLRSLLVHEGEPGANRPVFRRLARIAEVARFSCRG